MSNVSLPREELIDSILSKYATTVYRLAFARVKNSHDAEDILQEVFMKYIKSDLEFKSEDHRKAWLLKVTINISKNLLKSEWFKKTTALDCNLSTFIEEKSEVYKYVLGLPTKYRTVIHLFYYEDMSIIEISKLLDIKESTIRSQLHRARSILKENMKGDESFDF